ncbi:translational GTPase TypA [Alicyclobacillus fructus]|uniref:translational GTPase TypA n=1 Tax=Alicyclobacillus fructus TaxID=2816082 RepID=UPI001A8FE518|nr:translational GTPase TypA [Alicyclobacillus fructus]
MRTITHDRLRNVAIVAHVDHGKTSLVDQMLRQSGLFRDNQQIAERALDYNDLERERGITILAKATAIPYESYRINIVDTPGHADFGGEVERILRMVDGILLVVDAFEGVMPQTRFVLDKALSAHLVPIVVLNKMERPNARPAEVIDEVLELFIDLGASDEQLDFPVIYASAIEGRASTDPDDLGSDMRPLFDAIVQHIPSPRVDAEGPFQWQATIIDYDEYLGRIGIGRVHRGAIRQGQPVVRLRHAEDRAEGRVQKLFVYQGLRRTEVEFASAGDIVAIAGMPDITVGDTLASPDRPEALPVIEIDQPTLEMTFHVNDSPFAGREGQHVTSRKLRDRLYQAMESDVSLQVEDTDDADAFLVKSRGELHLSILIETLRREGYELAVSKPRVIVREEAGRRLEPIEELVADVPEDAAGAVIAEVGLRKGELMAMHPVGQGGMVRLVFQVPTRGLIGFRSLFLTMTRGYGIMHHRFQDYAEWRGPIQARRQGVLVASETGLATAYAIGNLEDRGVLFITPGTPVYEGMIVGEHNRENDLVVNVTKEKHQTNIRSSTKEETVKLKAPRLLSLEEAITYIEDDELCEVTPQSIRLRKKILNKSEREKLKRRQG